MKHNFSKKALSLFLVVLMLMSSWVFVPFEAEAATAGNYYIKITWYLTDTKKFSNAYTGKGESGARGGISVIYRENNGTGTEDKEVYWNIGQGTTGGGDGTSISSTGWTNSTANNTYYSTATITGFPTEVWAMLDSNNFIDGCKYQIKKIEVGSSSSNLKTIWSGTAYLNTTLQYYYCSIKPDKTEFGGSGDSWSTNYVENESRSWDYPYANTFTWSNTPEDMTAPATNDAAAATQKVKVSAKDQYGVQMFDPTWSISTSERETGVTVDTAQAEESTITVDNAANIPGTTNSQTATVTATWDGAGDTKTDFKTFTINDAQYTATFTNRKDAIGNALDDVVKYVYYGDKLSSADVPTQGDYDPNTDEYKYVFIGWNPSSFSAMTTDVTHTAQYIEEVVLADDDAAKAALTRAITYENLNDFDVRFNDEAKVRFSRAKAALSTAVVNGTYNRLEQAELDALTAELVAAMNHLDTDDALEEYDVIFMNGDQLIDIVQVLYGKEVPADKIPSQEGFTKEPDSENHYTVNGWDADLSSITENILVYAKYDGEEHTMTENGSVDANCVHGAGTEFICSCGYKSYESTGDVNPDKHENVVQNTVLEPTCTEKGKAQKVCLDCEKVVEDNIEIPAKGHTYQSEITTPATCTETGVRTFNCTACGDVMTEEIPLVQHTFAPGTAVDPDCTHSGYTPMVCSVCDLKYNEYDSSKPATAHSFTSWTYADNADGTAVIATSKCDNCSETVSVTVDKRDVQSITVTAQPTCNTAGSATVTYDDGKTATVTIAKNDKAHANYTTTYVAAECGKAGSITVKCADCDAEISKTEIAALKHSYSDWTVTKEATCETDGSKYRICAYCNAVDTVTIPRAAHTYFNVTGDCTSNTYDECAVCGNREQISSATGHSFTGEETVIVSATCTTDGYKTVQCANEGCEVVTVVTIAKPTEPTHTYTEIYNKAPDCHGAGYKVEICSICGDIKKGEYGTQLAHNYEVVASMSFDPTCEGNGVTMKKCTLCGHYQQTIIKPTGHSYKVTETVAPTCTTGGYTVETCENCKGTIITNKTDATNHANADWREGKKATCVSGGYDEKYCSDCGLILETRVTKATGHDYGEWVTTKDATCTSYGTKTQTCSKCGDVKTEVISALGHDMVAGTTTEATCSSSAYRNYKCSRCEHNYNVYVGGTLKDHAYTWTNTRSGNEITVTGICSECNDTITFTITDTQRDVSKVELIKTPTCTEKGSVKVTLNDGSESTYDIPVNENAHKLSTVKTDPTCTADGSVVTSCEYCSYKIETTISQLKHSYKSTVTKTATCTAEGERTYTCENCNHSYTEVIAKLQHEYKKTSTVAATCTSSGYDVYKCANCESTYNEITDAPVAHSYEKLNTSTEPTCTDAGKYEYKCKSCAASYSYDVAAKGHTYSSQVTQPQDCEKEEITTYTCTACTEGTDGHSYTEITKVALGHNWGDWTVVKAATDTVDGKMTRVCKRDGNHTETIIIPATGGHTWGEGKVTTEPTCTVAGEMTFTCTDEDCQVCAAEGKTCTRTEPIPALGHTESLVVENATCTAEGTAKVICERCNAVIKTATIPAKGHNYAKAVVTTEATCSATGTITMTCACGAETTSQISINGNAHNYVAGTPVAATCTESGYTPYTCSLCGESYSQRTEAPKGHSSTKEIVKVDAACTSDGFAELQCTVCSTITGTKVIKAFGHDWNEWETTADATCTTSGLKTRTCKNSKDHIETQVIDALGHKYTTKDVVATCTHNAYTKYTCDTCSDTYKVYADDAKTVPHTYEYTEDRKGDVITVTGHCTSCGNVDYDITFTVDATKTVKSVDITAQPTCQTEGKATVTYTNGTSEEITLAVNPNAHTISTVYTAADCTTAGSVVSSCACGKYTETTTLDAIGHHYGAPVVTPATCVADGSAVITCTRGDCKATLTTTIDKNESHIWGDWTEATAGVLTRECTVDGCNESESVEIPSGGHAYDTSKAPVVVTEASCTTTGTGKYVCTQHENCTADLIVTIPAKGHPDAKVTVTTAPTCTVGGVVKANCTLCSELFDEIDIAPLGHDFSEKIESKDATCTEAGFITKKCSRCDETHTEVISMLGHNMKAAGTKEATCTESGYTVYKCSNTDCKHTYTVFNSDPTGHTFGDWTVVTNPTAIKEGQQKRVCACGAEEFAPLPKLGHDMVEATGEGNYKAPTCTEDGYQVYVCATHTGDAACGYTYTQTLSKTGHTLVTSKQDPTCTVAGNVTTKCTNTDCDYKIVTELPATGHKEYILSAVAPTCTQTGLTEGKRCAACDTVTVAQQTVNALGHTEETVAAIPATCTSTGLTEGKKCSVCGEITVAQTVTEKLEHNSDTVIPAVAATCTTSGLTEGKKCSVCGTITVEQTIVPATDHDFGEATVTQATCKVPGTAVFVCKNKCGETLTAEIPVNENHIWGEWDETTAGKLTRECSVCHNTEEIDLPAGGHEFDLNNPTTTTPSACYKEGEKVYKCIAHTDCTTEIRVSLPKTAHAVDMRITKDATCTEKGSVEAYCTVDECKAILDTLETEVLAHNYNVEQSRTPATCSAEGTVIWKCATCDLTKTEKLPKLAHTYSPEVKGGTCLVPAYTTYTCSCGDTYDVYDGTPARGHSYVFGDPDYSGEKIKVTGTCSCGETLVVEVTKQAERLITNIEITAQPTCNAAGKATVTFDRGATQIVDIPVNPNAHTLETAKVDPTCDTAGKVTTECTKCDYKIETDLPKRDHTSVSIIPAVAPTCLDTGLTAGVKCDVCGKILVAQETVAATGHGYVDTLIPPTCTEQGKTVHECTKCAYGYQDTFTDALGHDFGDPVFVWNESGTVATAYRRCLRDANHTEALNVTMTSVSDVPTCLYKGTTTYTATVTLNGTDYTDSNVVIGTLGAHDLVKVDRVEATCTKDGNIAHFKCNTCYKVYSDEYALNELDRNDIVIPAAHTIVTDKAVAPTCTETGLTEGSHCSVCGVIFTTQEVIPALGHTTEVVVAKAPTCTENGYTAGEKCSVCGEVFFGIEIIPATGHTEKVILGYAPTCTEAGLTDKIVCSVCDYVISDATVIPAKGHDIGEWTMTKSPTCTNVGEERRDCSACDYYETKELATVSGAHVWGDWVHTDGKNHQRVCKENSAHVETGVCYDANPTEFGATCKDHSYLLYTCDKCSYEWREYDETSDFVDHSYTEFFYNNDATCTENGTKYAYCDYGCGTKSENMEAEGTAKNHSWTGWKVIAESTCNTYRIDQRKCSLCGLTETKEYVAGGYAAHSLILYPGLEPTCTYDGFKDYYYCVTCGYTQEPEKLPMLEHTDKDGDNVCDLCEGPYYNDDEGTGKYCDCMCHKGGITGFIYKIIRFFWQIFGINETCECGEAHY